MQDVEAEIDKKIGEVRTEVLDLSFGEIVNLYSNKELVIQPEYQRLFRWSPEQRSRIVESVLLELPVPPIFVIENEDGVIELIDGLQRVSSIIQFMDSSVLGLEELTLEGCDLIKKLNGLRFTDLTMKLKLRLKRSAIRTVVIKRQSSSMLRYEMFKRLNTGGAILAPQEIRNCTARMLGTSGVEFYKFLQESAAKSYFKEATESLSEAERSQKGDEELVLRFFALKNAQRMFRGSVRDWLDDYMEAILLGKEAFDYKEQEADFGLVFGFLADILGRTAFVRFREGEPVGGLAPAYFEAVSLAVFRLRGYLPDLSRERTRDAIINAVQSEDFRAVTGPGANSRDKQEKRIDVVATAIMAFKA